MESTGIIHREEEKETYQVTSRVSDGAHVSSFEAYKSAWAASVKSPDAYWGRVAKEAVDFFAPFTRVSSGGFERGDVAWFLNAKLNVSYNCVDRWAATQPDSIAIVWEGDEPDNVRRVTYAELFADVCRIANAMKAAGVRKGDTVAIYLPNCPEAAAAMLACTRIGAVHSVVFAGFSAEALAARIQDASSVVLFTADGFKRGNRLVSLKAIADEALVTCPTIRTCFVLQRVGGVDETDMTDGRDVWLHDAMEAQRPYCPCEWIDAEDPLFMLYTSGSTGKPKGMVHTTAGYLVYAATTTKLTFDLRAGDVLGCVADIGWITGHSYIVYGPLCNGTTTFMFESTPLYPNAERYLDVIKRHKLTQFYTAPTAIRAVQRLLAAASDGDGDGGAGGGARAPFAHLRVLGTVGEPINPEAWRFYYETFGASQTSIVDTYWQTETGGHMLTGLPGCTPMKPGAAGLPFFGVEPVLMDVESGAPLKKNGVTGILCMGQPWPGVARTVYGDHQRYLNTYMSQYPGFYMTGDGATRDNDGFYWINGRIDDVINVSGHRIGTAEVESAIATHDAVAAAAVIAIPHAVKGQALFAYVIVKEGATVGDDFTKELKGVVRKIIGPFAQPDTIVVAPALPTTRSGKTMRRLLRKIASGETDSLGDVSTLADPSVVPQLIDVVKAATGGK